MSSITVRVRTDTTLEQVVAIGVDKTLTKGKSRLQLRPAPFPEETFVNNEDVKFFTGLPSVELLKCVFEHVKEVRP